MNAVPPTGPSPVVLRADARCLPLADSSVDLICTSPPYFGLRSYTDNGKHYDEQIGAEATPAEFVDALIDVTRECMRVLKPSGSIWVNLGDRYSSGNSGMTGLGEGRSNGGSYTRQKVATGAVSGMRPKSLIGVPWRYALRCIDDLGLILRAEVVWCLSGGAKVYARTPTGDRPLMLRDLARAYRPEDVQLWNGERWTQVLGWNKTPDDDGALELELRTGERVGCTPGHRWPTQRGVIRADDLRVGDLISTTRIPEPETPRQPTGLPDEDIGWLVGLYIAEGSRSETTIQFAGHIKETARHARLARIAREYDGTFAEYRVGENTINATLRGSVLVGIIDRYVSEGTARTKRLLLPAWQRSNEFLAAVVEGYLSGDGHYDGKNDRWRLGFTANDEWASDLRTLAARIGAKLSLRRADHRGFGGTFPGWKGEWRWTRSAHHNAKKDGEVVAIRKSRARDFYDVGVADEPHLFALASGVLTHNSKPNGMPESVTDRVRRSHEQWFHFTKEPRYFSAVDEVREEYGAEPKKKGHLHSPTRGYAADVEEIIPQNPLGKLPGSVWTVPTEPLRVPERLGVDHFACLDTDTEVLTRRGWLRHDDLRDDDEVAGYDLDTGLTRWTRLYGVHRYEYDGDLVSAEARGLSMRLTPNHRTLVHDHRGRHRLRGPIEVVRADALDKRHSVPRAVEWVEDGREKSIGVDLAALLGWVAAEGWYAAGSRVYLSQSLTKNPTKVAELDALINRLGGALRTTREREWRGSPWTDVQWRLDSALAAEVRGLMPEKLLPQSDLPLAEARAMLDAFVAGDGHDRPDGRRAVFQKMRHNLDVLQSHAVRLGYNTTLSDGGHRWLLYLNPSRPARLRRSDGTSLVGREHYKGTVWCVTTGTGTFVARRRGTVFVTGNSFPSEFPRRIITGWSPRGVCVECGQGRAPVVETPKAVGNVKLKAQSGACDARGGVGSTSQLTMSGSALMRWRQGNPTVMLGYACACPEPTAPVTPAVILDPFGGTGTTAHVAHALGRQGISVDLSADYCRIARDSDVRGQRVAKVRGFKREKRVEIEGQDDLFGGAA